MFVQQPYYTTSSPQPGYYAMPAPSTPHSYYAIPAKQQQPQQIVLPAQHPATQAMTAPSPTLSSTYLIQDSPCGTLTSPPSNGFSELSSDCGSSSSFSLSLNSHAPSPQSFSIATPPPQVVSPQNMPSVYPAHLAFQNVVCSPGPVMYDANALQSAWTIPPQNLQWQPLWVQSPVNAQQQQQQVHQSHPSVPPGFAPMQSKSRPSPPPPRTKTFFPEEQSRSTESTTRKNNRVRCKSCSASGCRLGAKEIPLEDIIEATREIPEVRAELPEFFGEPQLNFEEFVHYAPIFRTASLNDDVLYYKVPRTTKERELNIPRRLCELFNRTFGPEDAPESKAFSRISPHNHLCEARCAIRNSIVKAMQETIFTGCRSMEEGNEIFNLIFRFAGVSMVKTITTNLPQVFTAVVGHSEEKKESELKESQAFECTGVVSLFNYHLFRRRIKEIS